MGIVHFSNVSAKTWNGIDMTKLRFFVNQTLHPRHQKQDKSSWLHDDFCALYILYLVLDIIRSKQ